MSAVIRDRAALALVGILTCNCAGDSSSEALAYEWDLPAEFPEPYVPDDNPMSAAKVELGRRLFYDPRLSITGAMSCASCHSQERAFTDGSVTPVGATGQHVARNSMSLTNAGYFYPYTWANPAVRTLEDQAMVPMFGEMPVELGLTTVIDDVLGSFQTDALYSELFAAAFPGEKTPVRVDSVAKAIASFERTLISGNSAYDRWIGGDESAVSDEAKLGFDLFNSERFECYHCHSGPTFTTAFRAGASFTLGTDYQNDGLYNLDDLGSYPPLNPGLSGATGDVRDNGKFRVPTLRNVAVTAPYMHDGSVPTLEAVFDHYAAGGRVTEEGDNAGDGRNNPRKSPFVRGFKFTEEERFALIAFLQSLTDESFLTEPKFSDPWQ